MGGEKKERLLFTCGEGKKRTYGKTTWNMERLDYFYTAEKNWKDVYNTWKQFSALVNGWERWEPDDKTKKDPFRTWWKNPDEKNSRKKGKSDNNKGWWENEKDEYSLDVFFRTWIVIMTLTMTLQREYTTKSLGRAYQRRRPNITKRRNVAKREKKGRIMTMNSSSKVIDVPLSVMPDRPQQERRAGTKYTK
jgi:hypothetical protein